MLAILAVTMFTACSITVVFYLRAAGMIEENYSGILYGRMQQTVKDLDESLKEIYYVDTRAAWDEASGKMSGLISARRMRTIWRLWQSFFGITAGNIKISILCISFSRGKKWQ